MKQKTFLNVAVLMGGPSREHPVSLESGRNVAAGLREAGHTVQAIVFHDAALPAMSAQTEVVYPALHGVFGEDGQIQALLEARGIPYVGCDALSSAVIMNKDATKQALHNEGLPIIPGYLQKGWCPEPPTHLQYPLILKPNTEGSTIGLQRVKTTEDWQPALKAALEFGQEIIVETFIKGTEITVGLLDGEALPVTEIIVPGELYDYDAKYTHNNGETLYLCPPKNVSAELQLHCQRIAEQAWRALGARDMLRVDMLLQDGSPFILEANSLPGFTASSLLPKSAAVAGIPLPQLCDRLVRNAFARGA